MPRYNCDLFYPSMLSSVDSSRESAAPYSTISEIFMTWTSKPPGSCGLESETAWSEAHF